MPRHPRPVVSNEEIIQWELKRRGLVCLGLRWHIQSSHPRVHLNKYGRTTFRDFKLRGTSATLKLKRGWQVEQIIRETTRLVTQFVAGEEHESLTERLFEIVKSAYTCPEFLASRRTEATDRTLQEAERLLGTKHGTPSS